MKNEKEWQIFLQMDLLTHSDIAEETKLNIAFGQLEQTEELQILDGDLIIS